VGKIDVADFQCFVAIETQWASKALMQLENGKVKGRRIPVRLS
jgi:ATP-independent RNA helicase DbpA